jgi:hypothetical protein
MSPLVALSCRWSGVADLEDLVEGRAALADPEDRLPRWP